MFSKQVCESHALFPRPAHCTGMPCRRATPLESIDHTWTDVLPTWRWTVITTKHRLKCLPTNYDIAITLSLTWLTQLDLVYTFDNWTALYVVYKWKTDLFLWSFFLQHFVLFPLVSNVFKHEALPLYKINCLIFIALLQEDIIKSLQYE